MTTRAPSSGPEDLDEVELEAELDGILEATRVAEISARRERVRKDLAALPGLRELVEKLGLYEDLEVELDGCIPPRFVTPTPNRAARRAEGVHFEVAEVERLLRFCLKLRHVKGKWAGSRIVPDLWQVLYVLAPVFGWRRANGLRLFRTMFLEVPRKNGKSTISGAIGLYLLMADSNLKAGRLFEPGAEIYNAATTLRQGREVFRPAVAMAKRSPSLRKRLAFDPKEGDAAAIIYERTFSRWEILSGNAAQAEEKMGLNPSGLIIDEIHVHKSASLIDTLTSAVGAREQPLTVMITTAGLDLDGSPYTEKRDYAEAVATGEVRDGAWWVVIWTIEEDVDREHWDDPYVWEKANPGFERSCSREFLEAEASEARTSERKRLAFCRLHLNIRSGAMARWLSLDDWAASGAFVGPDELEVRAGGRLGYGGLDLSSSTDLTSAVIVSPRWDVDPDDDRYEVEVLDVIVRAWVPEDTLESRPPRERALFADLIERGELLTCPGKVIDYDAIELELSLIAADLGIERLNFDRWGSKQLVGHLRDAGLNPFEMGQGYASMSPAMKELESLVLLRRIRHRGNRLLRYAVKSLVIQRDANENVKPNRDKSTGRIDPFVALVMAVDAWSRMTAEVGTSAYEDRGVVSA